MFSRVSVILGSVALIAVAYITGVHHATVEHAQSEMIHGTVPKSYGKIVTAISDSIGTGLVFEGEDGVIRFVSVTGMKEGELARYDQTPTHGGIPKSYGKLVSVVTHGHSTGLIFEDANGVIRFVTITGTVESELTRE